MKTIDDLILLDNKCKKLNKIKVKKGEIVTNFFPNKSQFGVVVDGCADLIRYDIDGNRTIVERLFKGDIFGEMFHHEYNVNELFVEAKTNVIIYQFYYDDIVNEDHSECSNHDDFKQIIFDMILSKVVNQNARVSVLTQRNMRNKILDYFNMLSLGGIKKSFRLPFSYTDLADYLNVDRSAMTREIANLVDDGFIDKNGKNIKILY